MHEIPQKIIFNNNNNNINGEIAPESKPTFG